MDIPKVTGCYLAGYGAVFHSTIPGSLISNPGKHESTKVKDSGDDVWRQAWQEIQNVGLSAQRAYDSSKKQKLQRIIVTSLKHAANMSQVKTNEDIVVVVSASNDHSSLILQASKQSIDQYARNEISHDKFSQQIRIITHHF